MTDQLVRVNIGNTEAYLAYDDYYVLYPVAEKVLSACRRCGALTVAPGAHLEYHISNGTLLVQRKESSDVADQAGGEGAGLAPEVRPEEPVVQDQ